MSKIILSLSFLGFSFTLFSQPVIESIQLDTAIENIEVIYLNNESSSYYLKKVATFKNNPSQIAVEKTFTKNGQNGIFKVYYPTGRLKVFTVYANDKINGEWTYYDPNGTIKIKGVYKNGVKHGYWAYKSLKIYGKYKNGRKHGKWYKLDVNKKKVKSYYKKGKLVKGEGFGNEKIIIENIDDSIPQNDSSAVNNVPAQGSISDEYKQALSFLTESVVFRKAFKANLSGGDLKIIRELKPYFKKGRFRFLLSPAVINLDISDFIKDAQEGKTVVAVIDSILKNDSKKLQSVFNGSGEIERNDDLYDYSTNSDSPITVFFSEINNQLMRIDVVNFKEFTEDTFSFGMYQLVPKVQKFQVLLYFNEEGILKGAEYEKSSK